MGANCTQQTRNPGPAVLLCCYIRAGLKPSAGAGLARKKPPCLAQQQHSLPWDFDTSSPFRLAREVCLLVWARPPGPGTAPLDAPTIRGRACAPYHAPKTPAALEGPSGSSRWLADPPWLAVPAGLMRPGSGNFSPRALRARASAQVILPRFQEKPNSAAQIYLLPASLIRD